MAISGQTQESFQQQFENHWKLFSQKLDGSKYQEIPLLVFRNQQSK